MKYESLNADVMHRRCGEVTELAETAARLRAKGQLVAAQVVQIACDTAAHFLDDHGWGWEVVIALRTGLQRANA